MNNPPRNSKAALADTVFCFGRRLPRYAWFMLSGAICDVFQVSRKVGVGG